MPQIMSNLKKNTSFHWFFTGYVSSLSLPLKKFWSLSQFCELVSSSEKICDIQKTSVTMALYLI